MRPGMRVIDIGCGPGHILQYCRRHDLQRLRHRRNLYRICTATFGHLGTFHCRYFDAAAAREFAGADLVMMNGVLRHIGDEDLGSTLANIRDVLKDDGVLFTTDPCYRQGQSPIAKWLLDNDRGEFIRDEDGYNKVLGNAFTRVNFAIREDLSRLPYTFAIGVMQK